MALYQDLGAYGPVYGVSDANYQINPFLLGTGWDVIFDNNVFSSNLTGCEIYHIALDGPVGSTGAVTRDGKKWGYFSAGWKNEWDPQQPMPIGPSGQIGVVQFCWNTAFTNPPYSSTNVQPQVTVWVRRPLS